MGAPNFDHERRLSFIEALADLLGCTTTVVLDEDCRPDVVRVDMRRVRLLVGDAKDTETPSCDATRQRFERYAQHASPWAEAGFAVVFAICHDRRWEAVRWSEFLRARVSGVGSLQP